MTYKSLAYLPNKKILALIAFVLIVFSGWFYYSKYQNKQIQYVAEQKDNGALAVIADQKNSLDADTDTDGLKDWEEALWKTDSKNPDTDGDGASDGEEVKEGRDPLKPGPNDKISAKVEDIVKKNEQQNQEQETVTAGYAKKFLTSYLLLKQAKGDLTAEDKKQLVESFMADIKPLKVEDKYKLSDLKITQDNSKEAIKKYAEEMKKIFIDGKHTFIDNQAVFERLLKKLKEKTNNYDNDVWGLNYSAGMYDWLAKQMLLIPSIPNSLANKHLDAINIFNNIAIALENMADAPSDPVKAIMGQKLYDEQIKMSYSAINNFQSIFNNYGIKVF